MLEDTMLSSFGPCTFRGISDFDMFEKYLPIFGVKESKTDNVILDTLLGYEQKGYYRIENNIVSLTKKGLDQCRKPDHDWD